MKLWTPDMVIAVILVTGGIIMCCLGIDGEVKSILTVAAGWAFGRGYSERKHKTEAAK